MSRFVVGTYVISNTAQNILFLKIQQRRHKPEAIKYTSIKESFCSIFKDQYFFINSAYSVIQVSLFLYSGFLHYLNFFNIRF